jgi:hypothetical protein
MSIGFDERTSQKRELKLFSQMYGGQRNNFTTALIGKAPPKTEDGQ